MNLQRAFRLLVAVVVGIGLSSGAATLNVPARATNALSGQQFVNVILPMATPPDTQRENWIYGQIASGNVPNFNQHNTTVWTQRVVTLAAHPLGSLVDGDKKDVIVSPKIYTNFAQQTITKPVVIYGWHYPDGTFIQPEYNGHEETYADYSH